MEGKEECDKERYKREAGRGDRKVEWEIKREGKRDC